LRGAAVLGAALGHDRRRRWGQGPGHDALPDLRELQLQAKRKGEATDMHIWPEMVTGKVKLKNQPKSVVASSAVDMTKLVAVPYQVPYQAIEAIASTWKPASRRSTRRPMPTCSWRSPTCRASSPATSRRSPRATRRS
jgi:hypothetical protein